MLEQYRERAQQIQQAFKRERDDWQKSPDHTPEAKAKFIALAETKRRQAVEALQAEAQAAITRTRGAVTLQLKLEGEKHLDARRKLLGDSVLADIYRREMEKLDAADIAAAYQAAPTEWERQVIAGYGLPLLQMQNRTEPKRDVFAAINALQQAEPETMRKAAAELRDLDNAAMQLGELDREAHNAGLADRMGVSVAYMDGE